MKILVKYVQFHSNNYQGGQGQSFEFRDLIDIPNEARADQIGEIIHSVMSISLENKSPFADGDTKYAIQSMELFL